jgi:DNA end-binding protein Ku
MWPDEIRKADFASVDTSEAKAAEVKMAKMLVETLAGDFEPDEYEDDYREAVEALVKAKIEGGEVKAPQKERKTGGEVVDLLAALQRSVEAAKSARGEETAEPEEKPVRKASARTAAKSTSKAPAKASAKAPAKSAKKASPRKSATKKDAARKASRKAS